MPCEWKALSKVLKKLGPHSAVHICYEAGPTGYGLARALHAADWSCDAIAPSLIPKKGGQGSQTARGRTCRCQRRIVYRRPIVGGRPRADGSIGSTRVLPKALSAARAAERLRVRGI